MRTFHRLVFDESVDGTTTVFTAPVFEPLLGLSDALTIFGYASSVAGTSPTISVQIQQGPDRRHWTNRSTQAEATATLSTSAETTFAGNDGSPLGATRSGFARLSITLGGTNPKARVKIWVTGRGEQTMG